MTRPLANSSRLAVLGIAVLVAACAPTSPAPTASPIPSDLTLAMTPADFTANGLVGIPSDAPGPAVTSEAAIATANQNASGGRDRGPIVAVGRAMTTKPLGSGTRTVWVVVYGPGGTEPNNGPGGGTPGPITFQLVLVDDQTGAFVMGSVQAGLP